MTSEMWKQGRPSTTALVYSAIFRFRLMVVSSQLICTAFLGQTAMQRPQPTHLSWSMMALPSVDDRRAVGADLPALAAADAVFLRHVGLARIVLLHLTGAAAAAHADIFQAAAEAGLFMSLEMGQRDEHIGVHNGTADLGVLHILAARPRAPPPRRCPSARRR